jgi:hypothetical protein
MWLACAILFGFGAVVGYMGLARVAMAINIVLRFVLAGGLLGFALTWWLAVNYGLFAPELWAGVLIYLLFCELYIFFFGLAVTSISANLLVRLLHGKMTDEDIDRLYGSRAMVAARLDRLVATRLLTATAEGLKLAPKGERTVRIFDRIRRFFRHPPLASHPTDEYSWPRLDRD